MSDDERTSPVETVARPADHTVHDDVMRVNVDDVHIEINSVRMFSFDELPLDKLVRCTNLVLRKNLLHDMVAFPEALRQNLVELDLFDNKISKLSPFFSASSATGYPDGVTSCRFHRLQKLDLSYNQLKRIEGLDDLGGTLEELYLVENRLKRVEGLDRLINLKLLELGGNRIREIGDALRPLVNLEQLWLGKNKIESIGTSLVTLSKLRRLSLQANRLTAVSAESFPEGAHPQLQELFLSENGLTVFDGIQHLRALGMLDCSFNPITTLGRPGLAGAEAGASSAAETTVVSPRNFPELNEFWLTDGKLSDWSEVGGVFGPFRATLRTIYLERNPLEDDQRYRAKVFHELPFLEQIDSWPVVNRDDPEKDRARTHQRESQRLS